MKKFISSLVSFRVFIPGFVVMTGVIVMLFAGCEHLPGRHKPVGLMVDLLSRPWESVITNPRPRFSWVIEDNRPGAFQTAYQIQLASLSEKLSGKNADIWDSGIVHSAQSVSVSFTGGDLQAERTYYWRVRTWDQHQRPGRWSRPQQFHTGTFDRSVESWPGESLRVPLKTNGGDEYVFENRHPIRYHKINPVSVALNEAGNHFIRFEKAAFGTLQLSLSSPEKADTLIIHLGEKDAPGNRVDRNPGGSIAYVRHKLAVSPGKTDYTLELPRFVATWPHSQVLADNMPEVTPFRFAEIEGWSGEILAGQVNQLALYYHFDDDASYFNSSSDNLNQIWDLCKHTLKVTPFMGVYVDGGGRERMPYEADSYVQQISHYAVDREFAVQRYTTNFLIYKTSKHTEWHLHLVLMAWADYMATGDAAFLEKHYDELRHKTLLALAREDGLISTRTGLVTDEFLASIHYPKKDFEDIVDWPQGTPADEPEMRPPLRYSGFTIEGETDRYIFSDINTVVNAFHYRNLVLMGRIARVLGKTEEEAFFRNRSSLVRASINEKLLNKDTGLYADGEDVDHSALHANMFPVAFGLAPEEHHPILLEYIKSKGMACSPYGAPYLFDALYELGADDYAFELLTSETDRSWMNMIRIGATITAEAWDLKYKRNMTWNHAWGASPAYIITRRLFGIEPLEPGFGRVQIRPRLGGLEFAEIKSPTIRGPVYVKFDNSVEGLFLVEMAIPANTRARLVLPLAEEQCCYTLLVNGRQTDALAIKDELVLDNLVAGTYHVELRIKNNEDQPY